MRTPSLFPDFSIINGSAFKRRKAILPSPGPGESSVTQSGQNSWPAS